MYKDWKLHKLASQVGFVLFVSFQLAIGGTLYVPSTDYPTIQAAVDAAKPGDTVVVAPGIYNEQLVIRATGIKIMASGGPDKTIISGVQAGATIDMYGKEIIVTGFTIRHASTFDGGWGFTIIMVSRGAQITEISNCVVGGTDIYSLYTIYVSAEGGIDKISNSYITGGWSGTIRVENGGHIGSIEKCEVRGRDYVISGPVELVEGNQVTGKIRYTEGIIRGNKIAGSLYGGSLVEFNQVEGNIYTADIVRYNTVKGCICSATNIVGNVCGAIDMRYRNESLIENNLLRKELSTNACCEFYTPGGISVTGGTNVTIRGNVLEGEIVLGFGDPSSKVDVEYNHITAISTDGSNQISVVKNTIVQSVFLARSKNVWVYLNNVLGGAANGSMWEDTHYFESTIPIEYKYHGLIWNSRLGNYWGENISLVDANDDGIGDEPLRLYCPFHCVYDLFPLVQPANFYLTERPEEPVGCRAERIEGSRVAISWANPADMDLYSVVLVRRTDKFPSGPQDGIQIAVFRYPAPETKPGAYVQVFDEGLDPKATGYYAVFVQDFSGFYNEAVVYGVNAWKVASAEEISPPGYRDSLVGQIEQLQRVVADALDSYADIVAEMIAKAATVQPKLESWISISALYMFGDDAAAFLRAMEYPSEVWDLAEKLARTGLFVGGRTYTDFVVRRRYEVFEELIRQLSLGAYSWFDNYPKVNDFLKKKVPLSADGTTFLGTDEIKQALEMELRTLQALLPEEISPETYLVATRQLERLRFALLTLSKRENVCVARDSVFIGGALWTNYHEFNVLWLKREKVKLVSGVLSWVSEGLTVGKIALMILTSEVSAAIEILRGIAGAVEHVGRTWVASVEDLLTYLSVAGYENLITEVEELYKYITNFHNLLLQNINYKNIRIIHTTLYHPDPTSGGLLLHGVGEIVVRNDASADVQIQVSGTIHALKSDIGVASIPIGVISSSPYTCVQGGETSIQFTYEVLAPKASGTCTYLFAISITTAAALTLDVVQVAAVWSVLDQAPSVETEMYSGILGEGESRRITVEPEANTRVLTVSLSYGGSDLDLHVYDSAGHHVGLDYGSMVPEAEIPGASYSGAETLPEIIRIPVVDPSVSYTVEIVAREAPPDGEPYSLLVVQEECSSAIPSVQPMRIALDAEAGESIFIGVNILELGQQVGLEGISISTTGFSNSGGQNISEISWRLLNTVERLPPGGTASVFLQISLSEDVLGGTYTGQISISGKDGLTGHQFEFDVWVSVNVKVGEPTPPGSERKATVTVGPHPVPPEGCIFWLNLPKDAVEADLKIFDVDGALLVSIPLDPTADRYPQTGRWIPRDAQGRLLGTGLYLYLVEIVHSDGRVTRSPVQKMVIQR